MHTRTSGAVEWQSNRAAKMEARNMALMHPSIERYGSNRNHATASGAAYFFSSSPLSSLLPSPSSPSSSSPSSSPDASANFSIIAAYA